MITVVFHSNFTQICSEIFSKQLDNIGFDNYLKQWQFMKTYMRQPALMG